MSINKKLKKRFDTIFKGEYEPSILSQLVEHIEKTKRDIQVESKKWTEKDVVLISYGDSVIKTNEDPLKTLHQFLNQYIGKSISYVHILPFFPYSSDDGFSVIDYLMVNPDLGNWSHVKDLKEDYKLMFDLVINHISQFSEWFTNYKNGIEPGKSYFIETDSKEDLSQVVRPRSLPLLTTIQTPDGEKHVWTTFSDDQIDLNFANPKLMAEMIKVFLFYLEQGASMIRLDAIAFLWKEIGTNCLHLPETHEFVKLLRDITDYINPGLILLTETNVPNKENLSYFGDNDEANMVYQFSLPPLLLHALYVGNSTYLSKWAATVPVLPEECTFFNFTASHDGVGVRPLEGLVPKEELDTLVSGMRSFGGKVNTKRNNDGTDSPYELNITYFDALKGTIQGEDTMQVERFICSQTVMMSLIGIPAFYIHSLLATKNYTDGIEITGMNRTINRRKWDVDELDELLNSDTHHSVVLRELLKRIDIRRIENAFFPSKRQTILDLNSGLFGVVRGDDELFAIFNITGTTQNIDIKSFVTSERLVEELIEGVQYVLDNENCTISLKPYQAIWLKPV